MKSPRRASAIVLASAALLLGACSSTSSAPTTTSTTFPIPHAKEPAAPQVTTTTIVINGVTVTVPREEYNPGRPINPMQDTGQQIIITSQGVLPQALLTPSPTTITWTNLTAKPVTVSYSKFGAPGTSGPIAPGGHFSLSASGTGNIPYNTSNRWHGTIGVALLPLAAIPQTTTTTTAPTG